MQKDELISRSLVEMQGRSKKAAIVVDGVALDKIFNSHIAKDAKKLGIL